MSRVDELKEELASLQALTKAEERYEKAKSAFLSAKGSATKKAEYRDAMANLDAVRSGGDAK